MSKSNLKVIDFEPYNVRGQLIKDLKYIMKERKIITDYVIIAIEDDEYTRSANGRLFKLCFSLDEYKLNLMTNNRADE